MTRDRQLIDDKFNEYFTTIGSELTKDITTVTKKPEDYLDGIYKNSMFLAPTITIFIKGDATLISNYRPISVLPVFSKIFDKLVYGN